MDDRELFLLERYKYVLSRKQSLNANTFLIMTFYQTFLGLIVAGQFSIVAAFKEEKLAADLSRGGSYALLSLLLLVSLFALSMVVSGAVAWSKYRNQEAEIEFKFLGMSRPSPSLSNLFYWYETYFCVGVLVMLGAYVTVLVHYLLPLF